MTRAATLEEMRMFAVGRIKGRQAAGLAVLMALQEAAGNEPEIDPEPPPEQPPEEPPPEEPPPEEPPPEEPAP